jgi:hypothetical protein
MNYSTLSPESETCNRSPAISSPAFHAQPPDLRFASLIDMGFAAIGPLAQRSRLRSGSCTLARVFCSTLPRDPTSRRRPCASLSLHLYQVVKRTYTSKLSTPARRTANKKGPLRGPILLQPRTRRKCAVVSCLLAAYLRALRLPRTLPRWRAHTSFHQRKSPSAPCYRTGRRWWNTRWRPRLSGAEEAERALWRPSPCLWRC